jgi:ferredoxin
MISTMRPHISEEQCRKCRECVETCPYEVFAEREGDIVVERPEDCIECTACVDSCPEQAISMGD